jgi:alkyl hydroperoxide reductase subunit AhpC
MLTVGDKFPSFCLKAVTSNHLSTAFINVTEKSDAKKWKVFFFYPKDFTFVCPTELAGFNELNSEFENRNTKIYGGSTDSEFVHLAWRKENSSLNNLNYPLISDIKRELSQALGILDRSEGVCLRATFIVDLDNTIRYASVNDLSVGRNPKEVLRILDALQTGNLTPCSWNKGEDVLRVA